MGASSVVTAVTVVDAVVVLFLFFLACFLYFSFLNLPPDNNNFLTEQQT